MNRLLTALTVIILAIGYVPSQALAGGGGGDGDDHHGSEIVHGAAHEGQTGVTIFADGGEVHYIVSTPETCKYPLAWAEDVIALGTDSEYYDIIGDLVTRVLAGTLDIDTKFGIDVPEAGGNSCIQHVYRYFGSCTDEERIAVRAIDVLWDARLSTIGSYGAIGLHEYPERYCVEVVDIDLWRQMIRASDYLPKPVRATYPQYRTLVGLDNHVWYEVDTGDDRYFDSFHVALPTPGTTYEVDVDIWLKELAIDTDGDGDWDHEVTCSGDDAASVTDCGGSLVDPIFTFHYEDRAFHQFIIESRWAGEAIDESGIVHILDPDYLSVQHIFDWETVEVRSSLDG